MNHKKRAATLIIAFAFFVGFPFAAGGQELEMLAKRAVTQSAETIARLKQILSE